MTLLACVGLAAVGACWQLKFFGAQMKATAWVLEPEV
jgi:hypothetical protein